jgi:mannose-6-phosphate isomerase-like protein (cupin superfamily)
LHTTATRRYRGGVARYTFRRLSSLPTHDDGWIRVVSIDEARSDGGEVRFHHAVLRPGGRLAEEVSEAETTVLFTLGGRGAIRIERDRIEVQTNELISIPPGCPFAIETVGGTNWVFLRLEYRPAS